MTTVDLTGHPTGPNPAFRPSQDATPLKTHRASDGHVYGWVRLEPVPTEPRRSLRTASTERLLSTPPRPLPQRPRLVHDLDGHEQRPDPLEARTAQEFMHVMRRYHVWAGDSSYRALETLCGGVVKRSTFQVTLNGSQLPSYVFLTAFVTACAGEDPEEMRRWVTAWRQIRLSCER